MPQARRSAPEILSSRLRPRQHATSISSRRSLSRSCRRTNQGGNLRSQTAFNCNHCTTMMGDVAAARLAKAQSSLNNSNTSRATRQRRARHSRTGSKRLREGSRHHSANPRRKARRMTRRSRSRPRNGWRRVVSANNHSDSQAVESSDMPMNSAAAAAAEASQNQCCSVPFDSADHDCFATLSVCSLNQDSPSHDKDALPSNNHQATASQAMTVEDEQLEVQSSASSSDADEDVEDGDEVFYSMHTDQLSGYQSVGTEALANQNNDVHSSYSAQEDSVS